jgi:hypothetical protein
MVGAGYLPVFTMKSTDAETGPSPTCAVQVYPRSASVCVQDQVWSLATDGVHVRRVIAESKLATVTLAPAAAPLLPKNTTLLRVTISA